MKIIVDCDGVLRDLHSHLLEYYGVPNPTQWHWKYENKNIFQWAEKDRLRILEQAERTEYFDVITSLVDNPIEIWTAQPLNWREYTKNWLNNNLNKDYIVYFLSNAEKRERLDEIKDAWLIEDHPGFTSYDRIILIDKPYNQDVKTDFRVNNPTELELMLKKLKWNS